MVHGSVFVFPLVLRRISPASTQSNKLMDGWTQVWRTVLEGALLEARSGNTDVARKVLKYLMTHVPWYGPIYYEAFRCVSTVCVFARVCSLLCRHSAKVMVVWVGRSRARSEAHAGAPTRHHSSMVGI